MRIAGYEFLIQYRGADNWNYELRKAFYTPTDVNSAKAYYDEYDEKAKDVLKMIRKVLRTNEKNTLRDVTIIINEMEEHTYRTIKAKQYAKRFFYSDMVTFYEREAHEKWFRQTGEVPSKEAIKDIKQTLADIVDKCKEACWELVSNAQ